MMLSIRDLRKSLAGMSFSEGTEGTQGTANKDAAVSCSLSEKAEGTEGTGLHLQPRLVPSVPSCKSWREHETTNKDAVVPCVPSVPSQKRIPAKLIPVRLQDPACWEEDFARWALARCLFQDGCLWRVEALHEHFCDWCNLQGEVPCMLPTFAALVKSEGFMVTAGMVQGLVLREEYLSLTELERKAKAMPRAEDRC